MSELQELRSKFNQEQGKLLQLLSDKQITQEKIDNGVSLRIDIEESQLIIQTVSQGIQNQISEYISDLISSALVSVFDNPYSLKLEFVQRRGKTEADLKFIRDDEEIDPIDAAGGGITNVASFALRPALWSLLKNTRNIILLDEPVHFLHNPDAQRRYSELCHSISEELCLQIIMITGEESEEIISQADRVFRLKLIDGITQVEMEE